MLKTWDFDLVTKNSYFTISNLYITGSKFVVFKIKIGA